MITAVSKKEDYLTEIGNGTKMIMADTPESDGGGDQFLRPGDILASGYAACVNITIRKELNARKLSYDRVVVQVEMDRSNPEKVVFYTKTEIVGNIPQKVKEQIIENAKECPVCNILRAQKEFLPLEEKSKGL